MARRTTPLILSLFLLITALGGCAGLSSDPSTSSANNQTNQVNADRAVEPGMEGAKDNSDELATLVKVPYETEDLVWKEYGGSPGLRVLAVFQLTEEDSRKLVDAASNIRPGSPVSINSEKWFPKELVTQSEMSGDTGIQATSYPADEFLQPPFTEGTVSRVDNTNFFVLEVRAK